MLLLMILGCLAGGYPAYRLSKKWKKGWLVPIASLIGIITCFLAIFIWQGFLGYIGVGEEYGVTSGGLILGGFKAFGSIWWMSIPAAWMGWKSGIKTAKYNSPIMENTSPFGSDKQKERIEPVISINKVERD